jgi:hypothetical protein
MPSHALRPLRSLPAAALALLAGCSSGATTGGYVAPAPGDGGPGTVYSPEASTLEPSDAALEAMSAATAYQGNPLCNASQATSCCYPDALDLCMPTACTPADAGTNDAGGGGYSQVAYGCHLAPAPAAAASAGDATTAATPPGVAAVAPACMPAGLGLDGASCDESADCAPGYECVGSPGTCRHYCCAGNSACLVDQFCDVQQTTGPATMNVPVCMPVRPCELLVPNTCPSGQTCAVVRENGSDSCVAIGTATTGQSCDSEHCAAGLVCLGATERICYALCQTSGTSTCPAGQACQGGPPLFLDPVVGVCQ